MKRDGFRKKLYDLSYRVSFRSASDRITRIRLAVWKLRRFVSTILFKLAEKIGGIENQRQPRGAKTKRSAVAQKVNPYDRSAGSFDPAHPPRKR